MATLKLNPAVAAARRAAKAAQHTNPPPIVANNTPSTSRGPSPATQVKAATPLSGKAAKKAGMAALREKLRRTWAHLFGNDSTPLKVGIRHDIAEHLSEDERRWLPAVLHQHVRRQAYINALTQPGAHRVGLDGSLTPVSQEQVAHAKWVSA